MLNLVSLAEGEEFYIKDGLHGRRYHEKIVKPRRKRRKRGLKPLKGRGTFYKDHPMVTSIHQRNTMTYFDVPVYQSILGIIHQN